MTECIITEILSTIELIEQQTKTNIVENSKLSKQHRLWRIDLISNEYYLKVLNDYITKWI